MKKIVFFMVFYAVQALFADKAIKLKVGDVIAKKENSNCYSISFAVRYRGLEKTLLEDTPVYISTEKLVLKGYVKDAIIKEADFIYSQRNVDLNGDKDFNDSYKVREDKGIYYLNNKKLEVLIHPKKIYGFTAFNYGYEGNLRINKVTDKGSPFLVYSVDRLSGSTVIGLDPEGGAVQIKKFPNPNVQIMIVKETSGVSAKGAFSIAGYENFISYTNDKIFPGQDEEWVLIKWAVIPFPVEKKGKNIFSVKVNDIKPPFAVLVSANISYVKGVRLRSYVSSSIIK